MRPQVSHRARTRADREGDPLDGLVNLFDLGIVLAVGFLLAALASVNLKPDTLAENSKPPIVAKEKQERAAIELQPGERVVGRGEAIGTVYQLADGRTIIVRAKGAAGPTGPTAGPTGP